MIFDYDEDGRRDNFIERSLDGWVSLNDTLSGCLHLLKFAY